VQWELLPHSCFVRSECGGEKTLLRACWPLEVLSGYQSQIYVDCLSVVNESAFFETESFLKSITANDWLFAVAGIGGFKNGAQRNVKADLL